MKQMKSTNVGKKGNEPMRVSGDIRDVRGASIRPSVKIPSKMDKMRDARRQRREKIDWQEGSMDEVSKLCEEFIGLIDRGHDDADGQIATRLLEVKYGKNAPVDLKKPLILSDDPNDPGDEGVFLINSI